MNLLPIGHCHQSVTGLCQAPVTKKTFFIASVLPFQPTTGLGKFSGGNPAEDTITTYQESKAKVILALLQTPLACLLPALQSIITKFFKFCTDVGKDSGAPKPASDIS